jgi:hypothetical protein
MTTSGRIVISVGPGDDLADVACGLAAEAGLPLGEWMRDKVIERRYPGRGHRQVPVVDAGHGFEAEVDEGIASDILLLWRNGIETVFSCQHLARDGRQVVIRHVSDLRRAAALLPWATCGTSNLLEYAALTEHCQGQWLDWPHVWERSAP